MVPTRKRTPLFVRCLICITVDFTQPTRPVENLLLHSFTNRVDSLLPETEAVLIYRRVEDRVTQIDAGYAHTLLLTEKGDVWTFGCGLFGQMGNGDNKKVG